MAEIAFLKRAKISEAQQYMLLAVLGASLVLGVGVALIMKFVSQISFNATVIAEEEKAIVTYSNTIKNIGICKKPAGAIYTDDELKKCSPNSIEASEVPGTLRYNILNNLAANESLNSVPRESTSSCINPATSKSYTYDELETIYAEAADADSTEKLMAASELIQNCSALRIIPDSLPKFRNEEALLSSLNKIFLISGWEPMSISPSGTSGASGFGTNLNTMSVRLSVEADAGTTKNVLDNIEHSIREFNIDRATIEWGSNNTIVLQAQATAYYVDPSILTESNKTLGQGGKK
ncbi:hypothetical protein IJI00_02195 [Candidatus Saccharibacteria bacterium]|nr:hypothetical protein [Candidatus Saccharibacteria bacterium]